MAHHKTNSETLYTHSNRILHLQNIIIEVLSFSSPTQFIESSTAGQGYDIGCDANGNIMEHIGNLQNMLRTHLEFDMNRVRTLWELIGHIKIQPLPLPKGK